MSLPIQMHDMAGAEVMARGVVAFCDCGASFYVSFDRAGFWGNASVVARQRWEDHKAQSAARLPVEVIRTERAQ